LISTVITEIPIDPGDLEILNPYAVILRYDEIAEGDLDVPKVRELMEKIKSWATAIIGQQ
jgi:hypothetical protein